MFGVYLQLGNAQSTLLSSICAATQGFKVLSHGLRSGLSGFPPRFLFIYGKLCTTAFLRIPTSKDLVYLYALNAVAAPTHRWRMLLTSLYPVTWPLTFGPTSETWASPSKVILQAASFKPLSTMFSRNICMGYSTWLFSDMVFGKYGILEIRLDMIISLYPVKHSCTRLFSKSNKSALLLILRSRPTVIGLSLKVLVTADFTHIPMYATRINIACKDIFIIL